MMRTLGNLVVPVAAVAFLMVAAGRSEAQWTRPYSNNSPYSYYRTPGSGSYTPGYWTHPNLYRPAFTFAPAYIYSAPAYATPYTSSYSVPNYGYRSYTPTPYGWYY
jgi:hypothetical protein